MSNELIEFSLISESIERDGCLQRNNEQSDGEQLVQNHFRDVRKFNT